MAGDTADPEGGEARSGWPLGSQRPSLLWPPSARPCHTWGDKRRRRPRFGGERAS